MSMTPAIFIKNHNVQDLIIALGGMITMRDELPLENPLIYVMDNDGNMGYLPDVYKISCVEAQGAGTYGLTLYIRSKGWSTRNDGIGYRFDNVPAENAKTVVELFTAFHRGQCLTFEAAPLITHHIFYAKTASEIKIKYANYGYGGVNYSSREGIDITVAALKQFKQLIDTVKNIKGLVWVQTNADMGRVINLQHVAAVVFTNADTPVDQCLHIFDIDGEDHNVWITTKDTDTVKITCEDFFQDLKSAILTNTNEPWILAKSSKTEALVRLSYMRACGETEIVLTTNQMISTRYFRPDNEISTFKYTLIDRGGQIPMKDAVVSSVDVGRRLVKDNKK